jgi:hypothetical protein
VKKSIAVLLLAGCGNAQPDPQPPPADTTVSYSVCIVHAGDEVPVPGMVWSVLDHPEIPTASTDDSGCVTLGGLPPNQDLLVSWTKEGYVRRLTPMRTGASDFDYVDDWAHTDEDLASLAAARGIDIDPARPRFSLFARDDTTPIGADLYVPNIEIALDSASGDTCYYGPLGESGCTAGPDNLGVVSVFNLDEGSVEVTVGPASIACDARLAGSDWQLAWPGSTANAFVVPLRNAHETFTSVDCHD